MIAAPIAGLIAKVAGARQWLTLLALGAAAAFLYVRWSETSRERDSYAAWADAACAAAGTPYAATKGHPAGQLCRVKIASAAAFRADSDRVTAETLAQAMRDHDARQSADAALARAAAEAARDATTRMEKADANVPPSNRVGSDWFAALNDVAGLHPPVR